MRKISFKFVIVVFCWCFIMTYTTKLTFYDFYWWLFMFSTIFLCEFYHNEIEKYK